MSCISTALKLTIILPLLGSCTAVTYPPIGTKDFICHLSLDDQCLDGDWVREDLSVYDRTRI